MKHNRENSATSATSTTQTSPEGPVEPLRAGSAVAQVELVRDGQWMWRVLGCPFCREEHWHGGGRFDRDPRTFLGGRVPHCESTRVLNDMHPPFGWDGRERARGGEYVLVEAVPGAQAVERAKLRSWRVSWRGGPACRHKHRTHITAAKCGLPVEFTGGLEP